MQSDFRRRVATVSDFLDSIGNLDFDRVEQHLAENAVMVLPFVEEVPPARGRTAIVDQLRNSVPLMFERMNFTYDEWYDVRDADAVVAEYHSECPQRGTGKLYRNAYITVFRFEGDKISLYKEYPEPTEVCGLHFTRGRIVNIGQTHSRPVGLASSMTASVWSRLGTRLTMVAVTPPAQAQGERT